MEEKQSLKAGSCENDMFWARVTLQRVISSDVPFWLGVLLDMDISEQVGGHTAVPDMFDDVSAAVGGHTWKN